VQVTHVHVNEIPRPYCHRDNAARADEGVLINSALQGRTEAFGDLVQPYFLFLNRFVRMRLGSAAEAEDIVQETVLRAFSHLGQFRHDASFKTWLGAIAFNEVQHLRRRQALTPCRTLDDSRAANLPDQYHSPYARLQQRQREERLHQALAKLPEKYRRLIQLRDLHELSVAETARLLALTVATVKTRHHRARKLLVRSLGADRRDSRGSRGLAVGLQRTSAVM
jgi:RNA polymerase sigma-70 factor (ECF subfamily)